MVKKHKGGRRQILQLEDKKQPSRSESEPSSSVQSNKEATPLDSQVADFFKEIDALTVNNHSDITNCEAAHEPGEVASCSKQKDLEETESLDNLPENFEVSQPEGSNTDVGNYCPWHELSDDKSGYNYYWNVETNQVTWNCPAEYIIYVKSMQSADGEEFPQCNQSNSNENHKKAKKKKDPPQPPEGAIIPISYFGDSSSDDSSDEEKENGCLGTTSKYLWHKVEPNASIPSRQKVGRKSDYHNSENKKELCFETMGPHLPPDNHFSKTVSSASKTTSSKEAEMSSKNEVDEYLEIGPQLASNSGIAFLKNSDYNTDCNTVSDSSSKCASVPHSAKNGPSDASSSTAEESWEISLKIIERQFKGLDPDIGEESPDSTVRKGDTLSENSVPCQTSNDTFGLRGVVEYDNFTDEEEEMSSSNISSSKQETLTTHRVISSDYKTPRDQDNLFGCQRKCDSKSEVSQSESQRNLPKRKFSEKTGENENSKFKKPKQKDKVDFDSIFNSHGNTGKYGFGFSRQEQLNIESEFFCSTSSHNQLSSGKRSNDYKAISFVKSDHVFDLSTLNENVSSDSFSQSKPNDELAKENCNENIYAPGPSGLNGVREINDSERTISSESCFVHNEDITCDEKNVVDTSNFIDGKLTEHLNAKPSTSSEKKEFSSRQKDVSSSRVNDIYKMDDDIDEIDRQLSEAFEAKKAESSAKPSSSSPSVSPRSKKSEIDLSTSKKTSIESAKSASNCMSSGSFSDDILSLSTLLIDKLTFLISNHSTLTSLSTLLIQIQTRLMDWQSGSLESRYFMARLQEVQQYLHHYEIGAVSGDWTCQWDRDNKRYFYLNSRTQQSQWTYPEELCDKENSWMPSSTDLATTSSASSEPSIERDELQTVSSSVPEGQLHNKPSAFTVESSKGISDKYSDLSSLWISESSPPPPPPGVDSPPPPPPPPQTPPPDSPPPPPPDSTEVEDLLEDMDIENSDDSSPPLIVTNSRADTPADTHMQYPKFVVPSPERSSENFPSASVTNAVSSTSLSGFDDMNIVAKSPQLVSTSHDTFDTADSVNMHWSMSQPSCSTDIASNFESESEANMLTDPKLLSADKDCDANASSSSSRSCDVNASSTSRSYDVNASSSSSRICDVNASSTSSMSCDVNASSSNSRNCDANASSTSNRSCDVNASSSSSRSYICSNEVTTYLTPCGPYPSTSTSASASTTTTSRKEKKKAKLSSGLALKKKNIPSLVEKWEKIKEEQKKEDKDSEDPRN